MDRCPICDVAVKPENLLRHLNDIHPRHPDTKALLEKLKEEPGRIAKRRPGPPIRIRRWQVALVAAILIGGVASYYVAQALTPQRPFPCIGQEGDDLYHWHSDLSISSGSNVFPIPSEIGVHFLCTMPLHTHDGSGRIHIESDESRLYSIGDFFRVWNKPWGSPTQMHVNGTLFTPNPGQILYDGQAIHLQYDFFA